MSLRCATIDLRKEAMKFSPGLLRAGADGAPHLTGANVFMRLAAQVRRYRAPSPRAPGVSHAALPSEPGLRR